MAPGLAKRLPGWTSNRARLVMGRSAPNEGECFNGRSPKARLVRADAAFGKTFVAIRSAFGGWRGHRANRGYCGSAMTKAVRCSATRSLDDLRRRRTDRNRSSQNGSPQTFYRTPHLRARALPWEISH